MKFLCTIILSLTLISSGEENDRPEKIPALVGKPTTVHMPGHTLFSGIPSIAISNGGRMWACWYSSPTVHPKHGSGEDENNFINVVTSADKGETWETAFIIDPDFSGPRRAFDPEVWIDPDGHLRITWADRSCIEWLDATQDQLWMIDIAEPDSIPETIPAPVCIGHGVMMCKPTVLSDGTWAFPVAKWSGDQSSTMLVTEDHGKTWETRGGAVMPREFRSYDEHMFLEKSNGEIVCYSRAKKGPHGIWKASSFDSGRTWTSLEPIDVKHTSSRFFIRKLNSGNWILVKNGPITEDVGRRQLTAYISRDEGLTWEGGLLLFEGDKVSYPDGQQTEDGTIYLIYDHDRTGAKDIFVSCFTEADILAGYNVSGKVSLNKKIRQ